MFLLHKHSYVIYHKLDIIHATFLFQTPFTPSFFPLHLWNHSQWHVLTNVHTSISIFDELNKMGKWIIYPMCIICGYGILQMGKSGFCHLQKFYYSFLYFPNITSQNSLDFIGSKWSTEWMCQHLLGHPFRWANAMSGCSLPPSTVL